MKSFDARAYAISDFLEWNETDKLEISPEFQRRGVWSATAKSFFVDTILQGKPFPKVIIMQEFREGRSIRVVVDGQQRLRAILDFYNDAIRISRAHNKQLAGKVFSRLDEYLKNDFLQYEVSVDVLYSAPKSELLDIFARINRYTVKLNKQELLNAQYSGFFKTIAFELGYRYIEFWREGRIITAAQMNRMAEAELASDLLATLMGGIQSNKVVPNYYRDYEENEGNVPEKADLFNRVMAEIGRIYTPASIRSTCWTRKHMFYTLFTAIAHIFGPFEQAERPSIGSDDLRRAEIIRAKLDAISADFTAYKDVSEIGNVPRRLRGFLRASTRATTDSGARLERLNYVNSQLALESVE